MTTVNGLLGGVTSLVRAKMQRDGVYGEFIDVVRKEYGLVFGHTFLEAVGTEYCLPTATVPDTRLRDFTSCFK